MLLYLYIMVSDLMGGEVGDSIKLDLCLFEIWIKFHSVPGRIENF